MEAPSEFYVKTTHDCGHKREVAVANIEQDFVCEACGATDRFTAEQVKAIYQRAGAALMEANKQREDTGADARVEWDMHEGRYR